MEYLNYVLYVVLAAGGFFIGFVAYKKSAGKKISSASERAEKLINEAKIKEKDLLLKAQDKALHIIEESKKEESVRRNEMNNLQKRLEQRETAFSQKLLDLQEKQQKLYDKVNEVQEIKEKIKSVKEEQEAKLEKISNLTRDEAKQILLKDVEEKSAEDLMIRIKKLENEAEDNINDKAKDMMALAMQRLVSGYTVELTTTTVDLPNDEMKGRIIGREGRNIKAIEQMTEPMVSHDVIAFYLLAEKVSKDVKVVMSGQGADEVFGGYFWYPDMDAASGTPLQRFSQHYFDRDHAEYLQMIAPAFQVGDVTSALIADALNQPQADEFLDQVWRLDVTTLIVDDPVKRVDNMPMAWGLEVRTPFLDHELVQLAARMPPELKLREGGKFPLKAISRGLIPDSVIDRPKGYFPVPALKYVRGPFLEMMRSILTSEACIRRGLYQRDYVNQLLAAPEAPEHFTRINGSKLWHLALLEWWLQVHVDPHE